MKDSESVFRARIIKENGWDVFNPLHLAYLEAIVHFVFEGFVESEPIFNNHKDLFCDRCGHFKSNKCYRGDC